jgi:hypothetical protein
VLDVLVAKVCLQRPGVVAGWPIDFGLSSGTRIW